MAKSIKQKIAIVFLLVAGVLYAGEAEVLVSNFNKYTTPKVKSYIKILNSTDTHYQLAYKMLTDKKFMKGIKLTIGSPEEAEQRGVKQKTKLVKLPDYPKILKALSESFSQYHNPLSAYIAMYIIKTKIPAKKMEDLVLKRDYAKAIYENVNSCDSYIDYFNILYNGIAGTPNYPKALKVIEASKKCLSKASDWQKTVIRMKEDKVKLKLGLLGKK